MSASCGAGHRVIHKTLSQIVLFYKWLWRFVICCFSVLLRIRACRNWNCCICFEQKVFDQDAQCDMDRQRAYIALCGCGTIIVLSDCLDWTLKACKYSWIWLLVDYVMRFIDTVRSHAECWTAAIYQANAMQIKTKNRKHKQRLAKHSKTKHKAR